MNADDVRTLWSKFLSGRKPTEQEEQALLQALRSDKALADELLSEMDLDGMIREARVDDRSAAEFERRFFECVAAEGDASRFIKKIESQVDREQGRTSTRRAAQPATRRAHPAPGGSPWSLALLIAAGVLLVFILVAVLGGSGRVAAPSRDIARPPKTEDRDREQRERNEAVRARARAEKERLAREMASMEAERQRLETERKKEQAEADRKRTDEELERIVARLREKAAETAKAEEAARKAVEEPVQPAPPQEPPKAGVTVVAVAKLIRAEKAFVADAAGARTPVGAGDEIRSGQTLEVHAGGEAVFDYADQTRVTAREDTRISDFKAAGGKRMRIASGAVRAVVAKQPTGEPMIFETPHGQATVLGTTLRLVVDRDEKKGTRLEVEEGKVELKNLAGKMAIVDTGHFAVVATGSEPIRRTLPIDEILLTARSGKIVANDAWQIAKDPKAATGEALEASRESVFADSQSKFKSGSLPYVEFEVFVDANRDYHVWVRGCCIATKSPRRAYDSIVLVVPGGQLRTPIPWAEFPAACPFDGYGYREGYWWIGGEVGVGPGDVLPPTPAQYTDAVPTTVRFPRAGKQKLRMYGVETPLRIDAIWLSTTQKTRPADDQTGP